MSLHGKMQQGDVINKHVQLAPAKLPGYSCVVFSLEFNVTHVTPTDSHVK